VVTQEAGLPVPFVLDGGRGQLQPSDVLDAVVRQDSPKLVFNELGLLFAEEVGMLRGKAVATPLNEGVKVLCGPRFGSGVDGDTMVSPIGEEFGGGMIDIF
jgi:hypothetical protein